MNINKGVYCMLDEHRVPGGPVTPGGPGGPVNPGCPLGPITSQPIMVTYGKTRETRPCIHNVSQSRSSCNLNPSNLIHYGRFHLHVCVCVCVD